MKKILFISPLPPPYYGSAISSEMCLGILKGDKRFNVKNVKLNYSVEMSDVGKIRLNKLKGVIIVSNQIRGLIKNFNPDFIYFSPAVSGYGFLRDCFFLLIIKTFKHGKLILHIRGRFQKKDWTNPIKKFLITSMLHCNKAIVLGPELIANLNKIVPEKDIFILPNAIPNTLSDIEFKNICRKKELKRDLNLLFLSNMKESKGWFKLLEACKLLLDAGIEYSCHFVGDWTSDHEKQKFYQYIEKNDLSGNIIYHGRLIGKEKNEILSLSDILIFPTEYKLETFGRVIIEAMEYGLPVISYGIGTIPSIIEHGVTGFILERNNSTEIFNYISKLLDKDYRNVMGIKSRERFLEKFTLDIYRTKFIEIFN